VVLNPFSCLFKKETARHSLLGKRAE